MAEKIDRMILEKKAEGFDLVLQLDTLSGQERVIRQKLSKVNNEIAELQKRKEKEDADS